MDLDVADPHLGQYVSIPRNDGAGKFTLRQLIPVLGADATALADFNNDGRGDGSFGEPGPYRAGLNPWTIAAADFDRDGKTDVARSNVITEA